MYVCMYVCMYVYTWIYIYTHIYELSTLRASRISPLSVQTEEIRTYHHLGSNQIIFVYEYMYSQNEKELLAKAKSVSSYVLVRFTLSPVNAERQSYMDLAKLFP